MLSQRKKVSDSQIRRKYVEYQCRSCVKLSIFSISERDRSRLSRLQEDRNLFGTRGWHCDSVRCTACCWIHRISYRESVIKNGIRERKRRAPVAVKLSCHGQLPGLHLIVSTMHDQATKLQRDKNSSRRTNVEPGPMVKALRSRYHSTARRYRILPAPVLYDLISSERIAPYCQITRAQRPDISKQNVQVPVPDPTVSHAVLGSAAEPALPASRPH